MTVTHCWRACHAHPPHGHRQHASLGVTEFTSILAKNCLGNEFSNERPSDVTVNIGEEEDPISGISNTKILKPQQQSAQLQVLLEVSDASLNSSGSTLRKTNQLIHTPVKMPATIQHCNRVEGGQVCRSEQGACWHCGKKVSFCCPICEPGNANRHWVCNRNECAARHKANFNEMCRVICNNPPMSAEWMSTITKPGFG